MSSGSLEEVFWVYRVPFLQVTIIFADSVVFSSKRKPKNILWHRGAIMLIPPNLLCFLSLWEYSCFPEHWWGLSFSEWAKSDSGAPWRDPRAGLGATLCMGEREHTLSGWLWCPVLGAYILLARATPCLCCFCESELVSAPLHRQCVDASFLPRDGKCWCF